MEHIAWFRRLPYQRSHSMASRPPSHITMSIHINIPNTQCVAGTTIAGTFSLKGRSDIDVLSISISLLGRCKTRSESKSGESSESLPRTCSNAQRNTDPRLQLKLTCPRLAVLHKWSLFPLAVGHNIEDSSCPFLTNDTPAGMFHSVTKAHIRPMHPKQISAVGRLCS